MVQIEYESNKYQIKHQNSVVYVKYNYYNLQVIFGNVYGEQS